MFSRNAEAPLSVHIPTPAEDRPSWTSVGVIAAIGFLVGVAWPKLAGIRIGPSVPENASQTAAGTTSATPRESATVPVIPSASAPVSSVAAVVASPLPSSPPSAPADVTASVSHGSILSCKTAKGGWLKGADCGSVPGLDSLVIPRLRKLADCPEAALATGKLRLVVKADFGRNALGVELGRSTSFARADAILACAKRDFVGATLGAAPHDNQRYSLAYSVTFGASGQTASSVGAIPSATHATADVTQIVWDVALVRDAPKTGKVVAHLPRGTTLQIGPGNEGWYPVKFGDGFASQGWIHRGAIGR